MNSHKITPYFAPIQVFVTTRSFSKPMWPMVEWFYYLIVWVKPQVPSMNELFASLSQAVKDVKYESMWPCWIYLDPYIIYLDPYSICNQMHTYTNTSMGLKGPNSLKLPGVKASGSLRRAPHMLFLHHRSSSLKVRCRLLLRGGFCLLFWVNTCNGDLSVVCYLEEVFVYFFGRALAMEDLSSWKQPKVVFFGRRLHATSNLLYRHTTLCELGFFSLQGVGGWGGAITMNGAVLWLPFHFVLIATTRVAKLWAWSELRAEMMWACGQEPAVTSSLLTCSHL